MPTDLYATYRNFVGLSEAIGSQSRTFGYKIVSKIPLEDLRTEAKGLQNASEMQRLTFLVNGGFNQVLSGLERFVTIGKTSETGLLWGQRRKKK